MLQCIFLDERKYDKLAINHNDIHYCVLHNIGIGVFTMIIQKKKYNTFIIYFRYPLNAIYEYYEKYNYDLLRIENIIKHYIHNPKLHTY